MKKPSATLKPGLGEMERGEINWYCEDREGRLTVNNTAWMLRITRASLAQHKQMAVLAVVG